MEKTNPANVVRLAEQHTRKLQLSFDSQQRPDPFQTHSRTNRPVCPFRIRKVESSGRSRTIRHWQISRRRSRHWLRTGRDCTTSRGAWQKLRAAYESEWPCRSSWLWTTCVTATIWGTTSENSTVYWTSRWYEFCHPRRSSLGSAFVWSSSAFWKLPVLPSRRGMICRAGTAPHNVIIESEAGKNYSEQIPNAMVISSRRQRHLEKLATRRG